METVWIPSQDELTKAIKMRNAFVVLADQFKQEGKITSAESVMESLEYLQPASLSRLYDILSD